MSKINDFLTDAGMFFLATVDGDQPKLRPLGLHLEMDGKVLFGIGDFAVFSSHGRSLLSFAGIALTPSRRTSGGRAR